MTAPFISARCVATKGKGLLLISVFFSGDRPGDMGQVKVPEILRSPNDDGFLFKNVWGKTLRDGDSNVFGIRRNFNSTICPVNAIDE